MLRQAIRVSLYGTIITSIKMGDSCQFISFVHYILNFQAVLGYDKMKTGKMFYLCGASIINKKYVLTAAHCHNKKRRDSKIRYYYNLLQKLTSNLNVRFFHIPLPYLAYFIEKS